MCRGVFGQKPNSASVCITANRANITPKNSFASKMSKWFNREMPKTHSPKETQLYAKKLVEKIKKNILSHRALVFALLGNLGSGKTTFIQGFARALGIKRRLLSPTFLIIRSYKIPKKSKNLLPITRYPLLITHYSLLVHIDAYRIHHPKELLALDFQKIISNQKNIILIEWAEKIKKLLPKNTIQLKFEHGKKENERIIKISNYFK